MQFQKATRKKAKLRCLIGGVSGSGKTTAALLIAKGLGGKIAVVDTERGSASLYSNLTDFDTLELEPPYSPERFIEAIKAAEAGDYGVLIIDSLTHVWDGSGGCVEINESLAQAKYKGNTWSAWSDTTPRYRSLLDAILQSPMHVIATSRMKTETVQGDDKKVRKIGMKNELRQGTEYEFTIAFEIEHEKHIAMATKNRTSLFKEPFVISESTGDQIRLWLESGEEYSQENEPSFIKRNRFVQEFKTALALDAGEVEMAAAVEQIRVRLKEHGEEFFREVWDHLPSKERSAIKALLEIHRAQPTEVRNDGRAAA